MNEQEINAGLWTLKKNEIVKIFGSLKLKQSSPKEDIIEAIINGEPTPDEIEAFKELLGEIDALKIRIAELEVMIAKLEVMKTPVPGEKFYVVVHPIKEGKKYYERGSRYDGENVELFLTDGQIRQG